MTETVVIVSGGMDSVTLAYLLHQDLTDIAILSFDYGQRHNKELEFARRCAKQLVVRQKTVDMRMIGKLLGGSALTDNTIPVPEGHYADPTMKLTVVPNRNMIMLSIAVGWAVNLGARNVACAVHAGDHPVYPDCRPEFIQGIDELARVATNGFTREDFRVVAPFVEWTKADIVRIGDQIGVPWRETWSCYKGGVFHCGACSTCFERREAFELAGVEDPTHYASKPTYIEPIT